MGGGETPADRNLSREATQLEATRTATSSRVATSRLGTLRRGTPTATGGTGTTRRRRRTQQLRLKKVKTSRRAAVMPASKLASLQLSRLKRSPKKWPRRRFKPTHRRQHNVTQLLLRRRSVTTPTDTDCFHFVLASTEKCVLDSLSVFLVSFR